MDRPISIPRHFLKDGFAEWMFFSRVAQVVLAIIVLGLDAAVIAKWNSNDFSMGFPTSIDDDFDFDFFSPKVNTIVGDTVFTAFTMFVVVFTLIIVAYDIVAAWVAKTVTAQFYHIYGETFLEFLLLVFWLASFAGMAAYVSSMGSALKAAGGFLDFLDFTGVAGDENDLVIGLLKGVTVVGALLFVLSLANFVFLVIYCIRWRSSQRKNDAEAPPAPQQPPYEMQPAFPAR